MKSKIINIFCVAMMVLSYSCKQDNYEAPNAGIQGSLITDATGEQFQTEQPNGVKIRLIETKYGNNVTPIDFWSKADGSFANTQLFASEYKIVPIEGAFFPVDTVVVKVNGVTTVNFEVTPYLTINATFTAGNASLTSNYKISRSKVGDKITIAKTLVSAYPTVSNTINEFNISHDLSGTDDNVILATPYTDVISGLTSGNTYYARIAARTANSNNKFNYSQIVKIVIL